MTPFQQYQALEGVNWSTLSAMRESPLHYRHRLAYPLKETDAMRLGRLLHAMVLTPDRVSADYAIWRGGRRAGKAWDAFVADNPGRTILREQDIGDIEALAASIRRHPALRPMLDGALMETPVQWEDTATGITCKGLVDWYHPPTQTLIDIKTTRSANARAFARSCVEYGYHGQLAHYRRGAIACGMPVRRVLVVAAEKGPPFDVVPYRWTVEDWLTAGDILRSQLMARLKECRESDTWPGRSAGITDHAMPPWADPNFGEDDEIIISEGAA